MGIAEEVMAATTVKGHPCTVGAVLSGMTADQRAEWEQVMFETDLDGAAIARVLSKHTGARFQGQTVNRHRRKECKCGDR